MGAVTDATVHHCRVAVVVRWFVRSYRALPSAGQERTSTPAGQGLSIVKAGALPASTCLSTSVRARVRVPSALARWWLCPTAAAAAAAFNPPPCSVVWSVPGAATARDAENQRTAVQSPAGTVGRSCSKKNKLAVTFHWKFSVKKRFTGNSSRKWLFQTRPWHFILRNATLGCVWRMVTHGFFYIGSGLPLSSSSNPAVLEKEIGGGKVARRSYLPCYLHLSTPNEKSNHQ
jgi:hypothetical protein